MTANPNDPMNSMMRRAGGRSRTLSPGSLPNIGQTPAVQAANVVQQQRQGQMPGMPPTPPPQPVTLPPAPQQPAPAPSPMAAPAVQNNTLSLHPPGTPADPNQYNYEPQPDGAWRVYPPGVGAPPHTTSASLPRAASTADYRRMREAFQQMPGATPRV